MPVYTYRRTTGILDNLLREYAGTHYSYDAYGNLSERLRNGVRSRFTWDGFDRLIQYEDERVQVTFYYDALNRRQMKDSRTRYRTRVQETKQWNEQQHAQQDRERDCGLTLYGWSGDTLAWESRNGRTTHYLYEPESFVPLAQAVSHQRISLHAQPVYGGHYDIEQDPLWTTVMEPAPLEALAWYQVDHLGTPQELTDEAGELAWSAQYKAWGEAKEVISEAANRAGIKNPLRFQGQYFDHETGLHYNRHRYYDPEVGRFVGKDPIGLAGGYNLYAYVRNRPTMRIDPLGLQDFGALFGAGTRELATLGKIYSNGATPEEIANAMSPPRPRQLLTLECRAGGILAVGAGVSVGVAFNEQTGASGQGSIPMVAAGARASATCGITLRDPKAKDLPASVGAGVAVGLGSIEIGQTSTWPELYIGLGLGFGPEFKMPATPAASFSLF